jgi:hypothetical protein
LKAVKRILLYIKKFPKGRLVVDTTNQDHSIFLVEDHTHWMEVYPDAEEEIPNDLPASKGPKV